MMENMENDVKKYKKMIGKTWENHRKIKEKKGMIGKHRGNYGERNIGK